VGPDSVRQLTVRDPLPLLLRYFAASKQVRILFPGPIYAGLVPKFIRSRLPVNAEFPVEMPDGKLFFYATVFNDIIARNLYWRGLKDWEAETIRVF
jgi:hypothetical protein